MGMNEPVRSFEAAFTDYVGAKYAIALCNGTATLHTALAALGVQPGDKVAVPPLTMASTTIAVLHAGGVPVFVDVDPDTWLMAEPPILDEHGAGPIRWKGVPVSLYGLHYPTKGWPGWVDDAAQTMREHSGCAFTSYSHQASKILPLGEGGMLVTDDEDLAREAREFSSLGYRMQADRPGIDKAAIKPHDAVRHHSLGWNYRMSPIVAERGLFELTRADGLLMDREFCAEMYADAVRGCEWITPQHVPDGWQHDYWCYAVAIQGERLRDVFIDAVITNGGERPYCAWRLTYHEPAFRHLVENVPRQHYSGDGINFSEAIGICPVAEELQPRLVQFQTNKPSEAIRTAGAIKKAIKEIGG